ncbi:MAG TPA: hypothetical protein EYG94_03680 [Campylobacterales bacterium]|nr:hypothetical protein [Campylobacterales bacterium]
MKKTILLSITMLLLLACETGVKNQKTTNESVPSGIVERTYTPSTNYSSSTQKKSKYSSNKIFSNSAQPGYYLQMAVFAQTRPNKTFLRPLDESRFNYIVLNKSSKDYVLIGAYKSYAAAKSNISSVSKTLGKKTFVVQVLRP